MISSYLVNTYALNLLVLSGIAFLAGMLAENIRQLKVKRERLASFAHDCWVYWSKHIAEEEDINEDRVERWKGLWTDYENLSEEMKDKDRKLVDKFWGE